AKAQMLNDRAGEFLAALQRHDAQALAVYLSDSEAAAHGILREWDVVLGERAALKTIAVLGTYRIDRRNAFVTTARLVFDRGPLVVRFGWQNDQIVPTSEELVMPSLAGP